MPLVTHKPLSDTASLETVYVPVDRHTLAKRRWRCTAEDGTDLAIDLEEPCHDGDLLFLQSDRAYRVKQAPEEVICIPVPENAGEAARLGWFLGNQHLAVEVTDGWIQLAFEPGLCLRLERAGIQFHKRRAVFSPDPHSAVHHHHH